MSIWPFTLGRFIELPYTMVQDLMLLEVMGERSPRLWLEKVEYVERWCGMALLITHPDYLRRPGYRDVYAALLEELRARGHAWHALPCEAARWWRQRAAAGTADGLERGGLGLLRCGEEGEVEVLPPVDGPLPAPAGADSLREGVPALQAPQ